MAQAHALLTAQMAEKIEKLAEMLELLLNGNEEEVSLTRWRMLRITHQLANNLEEFDSNLGMQQLQEQTQWLVGKSNEQEERYADVESSLESVVKTLEVLHNRIKQLDQRMVTVSTGFQALQQHIEQNSSATASLERNNQLDATDKKPVFELQFHVPKPDVGASEDGFKKEETTPSEDAVLAKEHASIVVEIPIPEATTLVELPDNVSNRKETHQEMEQVLDKREEDSTPKSVVESLDNQEETDETHSTEYQEEQDFFTNDLDEISEPFVTTISAAEVPNNEPTTAPDLSLPAPLRVTNFFDPRTLTLAERQKADNLKTTITLVEKFQLSKAFFNGDDSAFGQALDLMNKMQHLEEAEQHLAILANQYRWDLSDPQLLVLIKAVWRKLGVR